MRNNTVSAQIIYSYLGYTDMSMPLYGSLLQNSNFAIRKEIGQGKFILALIPPRLSRPL